MAKHIEINHFNAGKMLREIYFILNPSILTTLYRKAETHTYLCSQNKCIIEFARIGRVLFRSLEFPRKYSPLGLLKEHLGPSIAEYRESSGKHVLKVLFPRKSVEIRHSPEPLVECSDALRKIQMAVAREK